jgi:muramoyltetrapeptide carboxypeptidase
MNRLSVAQHPSSLDAFSRKPKALVAGSRIGAIAPASPGEDVAVERGFVELERMGFLVERGAARASEGYFAASAAKRRAELVRSVNDPEIDGSIALRGGYGSNYLLDNRLADELRSPKCLIGYSDLTSLQIYLRMRCKWTSIYGPMVGAGLAAGADNTKGYDSISFLNAIRKTDGGWEVPLHGETLVPGSDEGILLGGCLTLVETSIGTPWQLETRDSILLLEDRGMKPWQVDRALMHLYQAGMFEHVRGMVLGDFPECEAPVAGSPTVLDVCARILKPLGVPTVFGAPVGHTLRPMLTIPLGVRARLHSEGAGSLEILEAAVTA